jgi:Fe-Mn family superoxide dismutase
MFTLPDLPYAYNGLEPYIDEKTMQIHHDKHHGAYVKNLNDALAGSFEGVSVEELLTKLQDVPETIRTKVKNNAGGHANHSLFWQVMGPKMGGKPTGAIASAIDSTFGSFETFQEKFSTVALNRFGSGWVWLVVDGGKPVITDTPNQDSPLSVGKTPILALDVWEHAYYLKYQNMRADYIKAWWNVVNWAEVEKWFSMDK